MGIDYFKDSTHLLQVRSFRIMYGCIFTHCRVDLNAPLCPLFISLKTTEILSVHLRTIPYWIYMKLAGIVHKGFWNAFKVLVLQKTSPFVQWNPAIFTHAPEFLSFICEQRTLHVPTWHTLRSVFMNRLYWKRFV